MKNFKLQKKAIEKNKFHESLLIIMFSLLTVYWLHSLIFHFTENRHDALSFLWGSFSVLPYLQIFLIFFTFETCKKMHLYYEAISVTKKGVYDMYKTHLAVLVTYVLFLTAEITVINLVETFFSPGMSSELISKVLSSLFFYFLLGCLAAVFIGFMFSFIKRSVFFYFFIILILLSQTNYIKDLVSNIYNVSGLNVIKLVELFNLSPDSLEWGINYHTGIVVNNSKVALMLFWIVFSLLVFILKQKSAAVKYKTVKSAVCIVLCAVLMAGYLTPFAMLDLGRGPSGLFANEEYYDYNEGCQTEEEADFKVTKYKLDLSAYRILKARADIYVDKNDLSDYAFTLYHAYKVTKVTDQNGNKLDFTRENDYLTVHNNGISDIESVCIEYHGDGNECYSNHSGMLLTGNFCYYPLPGKRIVFVSSLEGIMNNALPYKAEFDVRVNNRSAVFCNLDEVEKNHFAGESDSVTVLSGLLKSLKIKDTEIIYPYMNAVYNEAFLKGGFESFIEKNPAVKKIFILPNISQSEKEGTVLFDDYLITARDYDIEATVLKSQTSYEKTDLAGYISMYDTDEKEEYWQFSREVAQMTEEDDKIKMMDLLDEILAEDDGTVLQQIKDYLVDDSDTRDSLEFLESLR